MSVQIFSSEKIALVINLNFFIRVTVYKKLKRVVTTP